MDYLVTAIKCPLFDGMEEERLASLLKCLAAYERQYEKNEYIYSAGDIVTSVGVVLSGCVHVVKDDFWGRRMILAHMVEGDLFGEAFSCSESMMIPVNVISAGKCSILFIDYRKIVTACSSACAFHTELIKNMLKLLAGKNILLTQKIEHLTRKTTREKLLSYFSALAIQEKSQILTIPFNRQELADYLSVERSAMSNELSKMRDDGILRFHKNRIELTGDINFLNE